jgi:hypothetical protein
MKAHFGGWSRVLFGLVVFLLLIPGDMSQAKTCAPAAVSADAVDLALDFVPGVCVVKDLLALGLGVNLVTGDPVTSMDAATLIGWLLFPAVMRRGRERFEKSEGLRLALQRLRWLPR